MSGNLEKSIEGLITTLRSVKEWSEHVLTEVESKRVKFQSGKAELDKALVALQEERANFINDTSVEVSAETSQALDVLTKRMEELLAGRTREETAVKSAPPAPAPQLKAVETETPPTPVTAQRGAKTEASEMAKAFSEKTEKSKDVPEEAAA